ncbi:MAG: haloacid dehalogenase [Chlorobiaceae bacterium]|jgi:glucose-1-phosphatase|nr:haloacid dehalogenase [Chlorobiaceae bacterium]NTV17320.1 haloacid dehalogenase [Chlorobiaceae bacterium]
MGIILLDIGNVIVDVDFGAFCRAVSRDGEEGAEAIFSRYCISEEKLLFDKGLIAPLDYLGMMAGDPEIRSMPLNELEAAWQNIFTLKEGVAKAIGRLREKHAIWIMSDTDPLHFSFLLNNFPVLKQAERYLLSFEHGYLKREPEFFRELLAAEPERDAREFILIDDREENCRCAEACGIRTHLFIDWPLALDYFETML